MYRIVLQALTDGADECLVALEFTAISERKSARVLRYVDEDIVRVEDLDMPDVRYVDMDFHVVLGRNLPLGLKNKPPPPFSPLLFLFQRARSILVVIFM